MVSRPKTTRDLTGERFGRLVVVSFDSVDRHRRMWLCRCDCGGSALTATSQLMRGMTQSCGCLRAESLRRHGATKTPLYKLWSGMHNRCYCKTHRSWHNYGGRGITVCVRWFDFENFVADMGERPSKSHSLDRIDSSKGYSPENCRWVDKKTQVRNRRVTLHVVLNGVQKSLAEWCEIYDLPINTVYRRIYTRGWTAEKAFGIPVREAAK